MATVNQTLSVILPTYNIEQYLHQCLDSVVNQTYTDLEIIIIDDNSTDSTPDIIREYAARDSRIKPVFHKTNAGPGPTRNEGLELATGAYVTLMDHDDWQDLDKYEKMMAKAAEHHADIVFCNAQEYNQTTGFLNKSYYVPSRFFSGGGLFEYPAELNEEKGKLSRLLFPPWAKIVRRSMIEVREIKFSTDGNRFDDVLYHYLSFIAARKIYFIDEILYTHRMFPLSISGRAKKNMDMMFDLYKTWDEIESYCESYNILPRKVFVYYTSTLANFMYRVRSHKAFASKLNELLDKYELTGKDYPDWQLKFYRRARKYSFGRWVGYKLWYPLKRSYKLIRGTVRRKLRTN